MKDFYSVLLNIEGHFQSKFAKDMQNLKESLSMELKERQALLEMNDDLEKLLSHAEEIASAKGIDISSETEAFRVVRAEPKPMHARPVLPVTDDDIDQLFLQYCDKAHEAGFNDVKIQQLLTPEELLMADVLERRIHELFELRTTLRGKETAILSCVTLMRAFCLKMLPEVKTALDEKKREIQSSMPELKKTSENIMSVTEINTQAMDLLKQAGFSGTVRSPDEIMRGRVPFDLERNNTVSRNDILGFMPGIGWLIGIINILTGTVTNKDFCSYAVDMSDSNAPKMLLENVHMPVLIPKVLSAVFSQRESVYCAVLREAKIQGCHIADAHEIKAIIDGTENSPFSIKDSLYELHKCFGIYTVHAEEIAKIKANQMLDKIAAYICAVQYDSRIDGTIQDYTVRTNQILSLSAAAAAVLSWKNFKHGDLSGIKHGDLSGIIVFYIEQIKSAQFWAKAKVQYLEKVHTDILNNIWQSSQSNLELN